MSTGWSKASRGLLGRLQTLPCYTAGAQRGEGYYKEDTKEEDLRYGQAPANAIATNP